MIEVDNLTKRYASGVGIHGLTFSVSKGELFVFLGPNGAGKSSTIKVLTGLIPPDSGFARVAGKDVARERLALKSLIGYMAENPFLYDKLTGREFLRFMADIFNVSKEERKSRTIELFEAFELSNAADQLIETYSQGMRQKIALAGVLIHEPQVLFLDEPTNGLDPRSARVVKDVLRQICDRGATVFMTTHVLEIAEQMCDRVGILKKGELVAIGSLSELREAHGLPSASLERIFLELTGAPGSPIDWALLRQSRVTNVAVKSRASFDDTSHRIGRTLVAAKIRASRNRLAVMRRKAPATVSLHYGLAVPAAIGFTAILMIGFASIVSGTEEEGVVKGIMALIIACGCVGAFVGSSSTALQAMFLADDIPFLLTLPIPLRALFGSKYLESAIGAVPAGMLIVASAGGYGLVRSEHAYYWPVAALVLMGLLSTATSISVIIVSLVTRYIPPKRARLFLLCISLAVVTFTVLAWHFLAPQRNVVSQNEYEPIWNALVWTPIGLGVVALQQAARGNLIHAAIATSGLLAIGSALIALAFRIFSRTFFRGLMQIQAVQTAQPNESITTWLGRLAALLPRRIGAMVLKEWLLLFRDLRRLSGAIWPVGVVLTYTVLLGRSGNATFGSSEFEFWSRNGSLALMPWGLSLGISVYSYGSEGRNIQLMQSLPFSPVTIFLAKVLASLMPVLLVSIGAAVASLWVRQAPLIPSIQLLGLMLWMIAGYSMIDTSASALAPNFETDQVQRTIGLSGRLFSFVAGGVFSLATLVGAGRLILFTIAQPASLVDILRIRIGEIEPFGWPLVVLAGLTASFVVYLSAMTAIRRTGMLLSEAI